MMRTNVKGEEINNKETSSLSCYWRTPVARRSYQRMPIEAGVRHIKYFECINSHIFYSIFLLFKYLFLHNADVHSK